MASTSPLRLRARWVVPVDAEPIQDGEVVLHEGIILEARRRPLSGLPVLDAVDLGNAALLPGFVNVHTHLDYTVFRGLLENLSFFPWIRELTRKRSALVPDDYICSATVGAAECAAGGITTIGDCTSTGASLHGARAVGLRGVIFQEVFGIDPAVSDDAALAGLADSVAQLRSAARGTLLQIGVSPHSPYTVRPSLLARVAQWARSEGLATCTHAAESEAEEALLLRGEGPIAAMYDSRGIAWVPPGCSSVRFLDQCGLVSERSLLVHGVRADSEDLRLVARRGGAWAHCPKSNAKLGNGIAPLLKMQESQSQGEIRVGLGSDSVASNNGMDLFEEMRAALLQQRAASGDGTRPTARVVLEMATLGGARALGMETLVGSLTPGKRADIMAISLNNISVRPVYDPVEALVWSASARDVMLTMVDGETISREGRAVRLDPKTLLPALEAAAEKICRA